MSRRRLLPALVLLGTVSALVVQHATAARAAAQGASQHQPCTVPKAFGKYVETNEGTGIFEDANGTIRGVGYGVGCQVIVLVTRK